MSRLPVGTRCGIHSTDTESGRCEDCDRARFGTAAELEARPTLSVGWTDDLKADDGRVRVWLARVGIEDGADCDNEVTVERLTDDGGRWETIATYPG